VCSPLSPSSCPTQSLRDVRSCLARPAPPRRLIKLPARLFLFQLGEAELDALRPAVRRAVAANMDAALHHRNQLSVPRRRTLALAVFSFLYPSYQTRPRLQTPVDRSQGPSRGMPRIPVGRIIISGASHWPP
jgi:hypothetical protein